ncbi:MAG: leucyl/phenylalanyl-tRNA--protein transferase [Gammaproteobacteria bacterium]|nr:leucyl/phenylalanyl-tRNA--protein transferase [Gammaproteobacteria bacterium]
METHKICWIRADEPFPDVEQAWDEHSPAPGLLAAGGDLSIERLVTAYTHGIFPWYSADQPILWWSPNPRMVLSTENFRLHRSMNKTIRHFNKNVANCVLTDTHFEQVIEHCSKVSRPKQAGTWIVPEIKEAYIRLHHAGYAHSVETWVNHKLVGGLYFVAIGNMVFGESMFNTQTDASKIALVALVALCKERNIAMIDCQQDTLHLRAQGATTLPRKAFAHHLLENITKPPVTDWYFTNITWNYVMLKQRPSHHNDANQVL